MEQTPASFEEKNKKTKLIYIGLYSLLGLIGLAICLFVLLYVAQQRLAALGEIRHDSDMLADKLHQSSDDLTRLVRTYAITGNKKYEQQFWDVLAIRNGVKPRPLHYDRVYWDFLAVESGKAPYPSGKAVPLLELMKEAGFTDKEFSLLAKAQKNSDQLVELEQAAMNAVNGKTTGGSGKIPNDASGQQVAIKILFGQRYHQSKIKIMRHINMFLEELENRTHTEYTRQASRLQILLISQISTFIMIICLVVFVLRLSKQYHTDLVSTLNSTVKDRTVELDKANDELQKNIVKSKQDEELAKNAEERLQLSLHSAQAGTWDWNIETGVVKWDKRMQEIFGIEYGKYNGTYDEWKMLVHPDDRKEADKATKNSIETGEQYNAEYRVKAVDGSWRNVRAQAIVKQDISGKPIRMVGVVIDISERKQMELALMQSEKLKSMGTITAGISHEFNNILNIISGNVQLLQMNYQDNKELMDRFCTIMESVDDGANITDRMREFTHSDKDIADTDFVCSDINELIIQSLKFTMPRWKTMAQVKSIDYQIDTEGIKGVSPILCDPTEIREVFINIINNALDAMPEGGKIAFCTRYNEGTVFISISDTGKGMTAEVRKEAFDPFFTTRRPMGTGLGLSVAYKTVMMHGGRIEVESEAGKGSTFTLQFPLTTKTVDALSEEKIPEQLTKDLSLNILVVDDEEAICKIMDSALSKQGHKVKTVNNGTVAIELTRREHFDLVLCDLAMPRVSGYDVVKALHKLEKTPKIGIITGWGDLDFTEEDEKKVDFIIRKPFDFSKLSKYINDVFGTT
jgi:PAS domain S-box-containing protein